MDGITFQSRIRIVTPKEFKGVVARYPKSKFVDYPWTIKESVLRNDAYTKGVIDCTVCGVTDGQAVFLNHICPTMEDNIYYGKICEFLKSKISTMDKRYLQGFLLGSVGDEKRLSRQLFEVFRGFLNELNIPTSVFRHGLTPIDVAYSSKTDEWVVASEMVKQLRPKFSPETGAELIFDEVKVSPLDELSW